MADNATNHNDYKVVTFTNKTDFAFTPELGCMYDSRPIFGKSGSSIQPGESIVLPYHVGMLIAKNLAKQALVRNAPTDDKNVPTGNPIWSEESLNNRKASYIEEMYQEDKPMAMSETDRLMAKVEEYKAMVDKLIPKVELGGVPNEELTTTDSVTVHKDKADVIAELTKRNIKFDARKNKAELEKLLV